MKAPGFAKTYNAQCETERRARHELFLEYATAAAKSDGNAVRAKYWAARAKRLTKPRPILRPFRMGSGMRWNAVAQAVLKVK